MPNPQSPFAAQWKARLEKAEARQKTWHPWWEAALKSYAPSVGDNIDKFRSEVRTNRNFTLVESKLPQLFYQKPEITVAASALLDELPDGQGAAIASAHGAIVNEKLGLDGENIRAMARLVLFDNELFAHGVTKMGYRAYTKELPQAVQTPVVDDLGQPVVDPLTGQPATEETIEVQPVIVKSECFWENVSPKQFLVPADFQSSDFDKAPWLAFRFTISKLDAERQYGEALPEERGSAAPDQHKFEHGDAPSGLGSSDLVSGVEVWYRTSAFKAEEVHPDHLSQMVFLDGVAEPVLDRPSPYQTFDKQGRLTPDSLMGYPLHPLVTRTLTDAAYVPSDVVIALPQVSELDKFREQQIQQRDASTARYFGNSDTLSEVDLQKAVAAPIGGVIMLPGSAFSDPQGPIRPMPHGPYPRENFEFNRLVDDDLARTHGVDASAAGVADMGSDTATEKQINQANKNARLGWEQGFVADWLIRGVTKYSTLLQRYLPPEEAAAIVGTQKAAIWEAWRKASPARLSFTMAPDSSLRNDTPLDRKQAQDFYSFTANDPNINRQYLLRKLLQKFHLDPTQALVPMDQQPKPQPPPPTTTMGFKPEDFSPMNPAHPIAIDLFQQLSGKTISPEAIQKAVMLSAAMQVEMATQAATESAEKPAGQQPHGGKVAQVESLSKHSAENTGAMQGSGQMVPGMAGGFQGPGAV